MRISRCRRVAMARLVAPVVSLLCTAAGVLQTTFPSSCAAAEPVATVVSLDSADWQLATDPHNVGRNEKWQDGPRPDAKATKVPWIIQGPFPGYYGVAWYWHKFPAGANPFPQGRSLLKFESVDYLAEVWLNGAAVGRHEGGETPFELDVTSALKEGENLLAVRVLNPTHEPIDGISLNQTARRAKVLPYSAGASFNYGGICGHVELRHVPAVYAQDLYVAPDWRTGTVRVEAQLCNASPAARKATLVWTVAGGSSGNTVAVLKQNQELASGSNSAVVELKVPEPRLWSPADPALYRLTVRVESDLAGLDEQSARFGFRDFRFENGYFRLNGRRIYVRSTHTCNHFPLGQQMPDDPDLVRRDLINLKAMGFNMVRFIWGGALREQLDCCDEIGLMVYQESYASQPISDSPQMAARFDSNVSELIRRDRNHPSVVIWGLLNEAPEGAAFRHAVSMLPLVRKLDSTRLVMLNSGRFDLPSRTGIGTVAGIATWPRVNPREPWVGISVSSAVVRALGITWPPGKLAFHPGPLNEYSAVRWIAPRAGRYSVTASFTGFAERTTTDVHVLRNGESLFQAKLNLEGCGNEAQWSKTLEVEAQAKLDFVVGSGNGSYGGDTTGLSVVIRAEDGTVYDATADYSRESNPNGVWSFGQMTPGPAPVASTFQPYGQPENESLENGSLSNPGSPRWEDLVSDRHVYPRVPHTAEIVSSLRTLNGQSTPVFLSEYGIGSAVDLWRAVRNFEQRKGEQFEDAAFFADKLARFERDYRQWRLDEIYPRPQDFFAESLSKMASQRTLGLNAIRSNANIVGHSLTGAIDHVMCGEGLTTIFRELKPGTMDALYDAWAPLRWCLFAEPTHGYRGGRFRLEAVLANEDALPPGTYPVRLQVVGPANTVVLERTASVTIDEGEPPFAKHVFAEDVAVDGPQGEYRFTASLLRGGSPAGGSARFFVTDPSQMPPVPGPVTLWGDDPVLAKWLEAQHIPCRKSDDAIAREVILAGNAPPAPGGAAAFAALAPRIARGSVVVFLCPEIFAAPNQPTAWLPLQNQGALTPIYGWLYLKDEWAKRHPIFDGMPAGGLMDYDYYREIIPDQLFIGQDPPSQAICGAIKASQDYSSGLMLAVYPLGAGRVVLSTLHIRDNLGHHPAADRILRNMLLDAARDIAQPPAELPADFYSQLKALRLKN